MLNVLQILDKTVWEAILQKKDGSFYPFFQSWNWGEVQQKVGFEVARFGLFEDGQKKPLGVCMVVDIQAKRGHYFHLRHGPVLLEWNGEHFDFFLSSIKTKAQEENVSFLRVSPLRRKNTVDESFFQQRGFRPSPMHIMDGEVSWVLDIAKTEEELLKDMRKSHRYLIKKSQGMDIKITQTKNSADLQHFFPLYQQLAQRKNFIPHKAIAEEFDIFGKDDQSLLFLAEYEGKVVSAAVIDFVDNMAIYRHGASLEEFRHIPASYLIQWRAIQEAKKRGKTLYHFWGIADSDSPKHPWRGLTLFKTGFGGEKIEFVHAHDLPLTPKYWFTYAVEYATKLKKGY